MVSLGARFFPLQKALKIVLASLVLGLMFRHGFTGSRSSGLAEVFQGSSSSFCSTTEK